MAWKQNFEITKIYLRSLQFGYKLSSPHSLLPFSLSELSTAAKCRHLPMLCSCPLFYQLGSLAVSLIWNSLFFFLTISWSLTSPSNTISCAWSTSSIKFYWSVLLVVVSISSEPLDVLHHLYHSWFLSPSAHAVCSWAAVVNSHPIFQVLLHLASIALKSQ